MGIFVQIKCNKIIAYMYNHFIHFFNKSELQRLEQISYRELHLQGKLLFYQRFLSNQQE